MTDDQAKRDARRIAHLHTQRDEGRWIGETTADEHPIARELIRRYNDASKDLRACPHLQENWDQVRFWVEAVPEFIACQQCTPAIAAEEQKRANSCCVMCGRHVRLRGISVAAGGVLLRGGICSGCEAAAGGGL